MSSGLTEDDKRRIESFCETPPYDRSPEDLTPEREYADHLQSEEGPHGENTGSLLSRVVHRFRRR
jgi:hypothetical protein